MVMTKKHVSYLKYIGVNQGNLGFQVTYFLSSLMLLNGVYKVRCVD